jgi:hypothetical protein
MSDRGEGVLKLFDNDVHYMLSWAFIINARVIVKISNILSSFLKRSKQSTLNLSPQEAHAQAAMILRRLTELDPIHAAIIFGHYDREKRATASQIIYQHIRVPFGSTILQRGVMEMMIQEYLGNKGMRIKDYALLASCSAGKASETRTKLYDMLAEIDQAAHYRVENLFYESTEEAA